MTLTEVFGIKVKGFWLVYKAARYLEQMYDRLSIRAKSWSEHREKDDVQFKVQYEFLIGTKRLHLFKPCWQGSAVCSRKPETLKA